MAKLSSKEELLLIADHKTGKFSQRELAAKHKVSLGYVNKTIKEIDKTDEHVVNAGIAYKTALAERDEHSVNAIEQVVEEKIKHLRLINDNATKLAGKLSIMADQIDTPNDLKTLVDANDRLAITLKVADRHAPKTIIENTNAQQTNISIEDISKAISDGLPD